VTQDNNFSIFYFPVIVYHKVLPLFSDNLDEIRQREKELNDKLVQSDNMQVGVVVAETDEPKAKKSREAAAKVIKHLAIIFQLMQTVE